MNKKLNKKGFTLVELLAVIVVLALILVLAVPTVLNSMNNAQEASFKTFAQKVVNASMQVFESDRVLNPGKNRGCYAITKEDLGLTAAGTYQGYITAERKQTATGYETTYTLYMSDGNYKYEGLNGDTVLAGKTAPAKKTDTYSSVCPSGWD